MNKVIEPCAKFWFANKCLSLGRVVFVIKLLLLQFSELIEPFNAEWCLVDDCCHSSNKLGFIN